MTQTRLRIAMGIYTVLGVLAVATLDDWRFRSGVLILLAGLAIKSWIAAKNPPE